MIKKFVLVLFGVFLLVHHAFTEQHHHHHHRENSTNTTTKVTTHDPDEYYDYYDYDTSNGYRRETNQILLYCCTLLFIGTFP